MSGKPTEEVSMITRFPPPQPSEEEIAPQPSDQTDDLHLLRLVAAAWIDRRIDEWLDSVWPGLIPPRKPSAEE